MKIWTKALSSATLLGLISAGPGIAGHVGGKGYGTHHYGPAHFGKQALPYRTGHPQGWRKTIAYRGKGYGHAPYHRHPCHKRGERYGVPQSIGQPGYLKRPGYGYGRPIMGPRPEMKAPGYRPNPTTIPATSPKGSGEAAEADPKSIVETAVAAGQFATLVSAVKAADLADTLSGAGPFTVFAPTDAAFQKLPEATISGLLNDTVALKDVLTYHVVSGRQTAADLLEQGAVETLNGSELTLSQLSVAKADVPASNGVIHILDEVLLPPKQ